MALLGPTCLFIFGKSCHLQGFLLSKYQKIPTYMPLLGPTHLLISETQWLFGPKKNSFHY